MSGSELADILRREAAGEIPDIVLEYLCQFLTVKLVHVHRRTSNLSNLAKRDTVSTRSNLGARANVAGPALGDCCAPCLLDNSSEHLSQMLDRLSSLLYCRYVSRHGVRTNPF